MALITVKDIFKTYYLGEVDGPVLKGVSLEIGHGEMVKIFPSGFLKCECLTDLCAHTIWLISSW